MAKPKRTKLERESDRVEIERLHNRGLSERRIAERMDLAPSMVHYDLELIARRYKQEQMEERDIAVKRKLKQLAEIRWEAWEAWEKSKDDTKKEVKEAVKRILEPRKDKEGNVTRPERAVDKIKTLEQIEGRLPANEYLTTIIRTYQEEAELLGLYAPKKQELSGKNGQPIEFAQKVSLDEFRQLPVEEKVRLLHDLAVQAAP